MKKTLLIALLLILLQLIISQPKDALACSGYPAFDLNDLLMMDLLVRATVIDTDDRGYNAVLRIEDYYKGGGSRYVTVMRYTAGFSAGSSIRGYDTSCLYDGYGQYFRRGTQGYFGLRSNENGTFNDVYYGTAHFYEENGMISYEPSYIVGNNAIYNNPYDISETDFINLLLEAGERSDPVSPTDGVIEPYPLMRFLNITTKNGTHYQVNPDRSVMALPQDAPLAISPDGAHVAFQIDDEHIGFQYIWTKSVIPEADEEVSEWQYTGTVVDGEAVRFSNDSNFAAVWNHTQLTIYMLTNYLDGGYGMWMELLEIAQIDLTINPYTTLPSILWSSDSTTIAWQDEDGLWHWDLFDEASPQLLMTSIDIEELSIENPTLMDTSQHGRFVRVGAWDNWMVIDTETGEFYPNAIVSPDERFLLYPYHLDRTIDEDDRTCEPPLRDNCVRASDFRGYNYFFYDVNLVGLMPCSGEGWGCCIEGISWNPAIGRTDYALDRYIISCIIGMRQLIFDPQYNQVAIVVGDYEVYFDYYSLEPDDIEEMQSYLDILNLEDMLDSPIASIEWGQPVFYDIYHLSNPEDIP